MTRSRWRQLTGLYLVLFFVAVVAAPHHHINDLEDLLLDQRSDSGKLIQTTGRAGTAGAPAFNPVRVVDDVPCLACFTRDFVCATTNAFLLVAVLTPLPLAPGRPEVVVPELVPGDASSRAPPGIS
jgi:hypothetical protein